MTCDYNFIKAFDLTRFIHDQENSVESIFNVLQSSLNEKQIRNIIDGGIKNYFQKCGDFTFANNIHKHIISTKNNTINHNNKGQSTSTKKSYCEKVFEIESICCNIFNFLPNESKNQSKIVCLRWLYDLYKHQSNQTLNLNDFFKLSAIYCTGNHCEMVNDLKESVCQTVNDLSSFNKAKNIIVTEWPDSISSHLVSLVADLKKIENITIIQNEMLCDSYDFQFDSGKFKFDEKYSSTVSSLLSNNCDNIQSITINLSDYASKYRDLDKIWKQMKDIIKFPKLEKFTFLKCFDVGDEEFMDIIAGIQKIQTHASIGVDTAFGADNHDKNIPHLDCTMKMIFHKFPHTFFSSKRFIQAVHSIYRQRKIKLWIYISRWGYPRYWKNMKTIIDSISNQMKLEKMIKVCVQDVKQCHPFEENDQWNGDLRWYKKAVENDTKYVCEMLSSKIQITTTTTLFEMKVNHS